MRELSLYGFTATARNTLNTAIETAIKNNNKFLEPEHILAAFLEYTNSISFTALDRLLHSVDFLKENLLKGISRLPKTENVSTVTASSTVKNIFSAADRLKNEGEKDIAQDQLLLAFFREDCAATDLLKRLGITFDKLKAEINKNINPDLVLGADNKTTLKIIPLYTTDYTLLATQGKFRPIIGRSEEINRILQILARKEKNNPILIGDPGVGKSALIEGIASRMATNDVPVDLRNKRIMSLNMAALMAGTKAKGELENRLRGILNETQDNRNIILFIDEIHTLVSSEKSDIANILKPALARGELRCIGTTTRAEYKKHFEQDPSLVRRFQSIIIEEPTQEQAQAILRGIKPYYELHHGVTISDKAITAAIKLSARYIQDRKLPDKAIDIIDEACSKLKLTLSDIPAELDTKKRKIKLLKDQIPHLTGSHKDVAIVELAKLSEEVLKEEIEWKELSSNIKKYLSLQQLIKSYDADVSAGVGNFINIVKVQLPALKADLLETEQKIAKGNKDNASFRSPELTEAEVGEIIARITNIPLSKMMASEQAKLLRMEEVLNNEVVGQEEGIDAISSAVRLSRSGLQEKGRPIGSFIFAGSSGTGKTQTAKSVATFLFDDPSSLIRFDMSEYAEKHTAMKFIGAPPGYSGYEEGGLLTEAVKKKPYCVLLFDEIEKAHVDVFNTLLQLLDDGRLTDSKGSVVDFSNCIIVLTTNLGSKALLEGVNEKSKTAVLEAIKGHFRPEFLNRIDNIIVFNTLQKAQLIRILTNLVKELKTSLKEKEYSLELTDAAKMFILEEGYEPTLGARPLKRSLKNNLSSKLAKIILTGKFPAGSTILADINEDGTELVFNAK